MADTWVTDITHFLDENGDMITEPRQARKLGEYLAAIIVMASFIEPEHPEKYQVFCRRRPNRNPCLGEIAGYIDPETDDIFWKCPKCGDRGLISNWQGTIWDMSDDAEVTH
jgi:hypothetical protein